MIARIFSLSFAALAIVATPVSASETTGKAPEGATRPVQEGWQLTV